MKKTLTVEVLKEELKKWRKQGYSIAFVPTMGNLHAGHIKLVNQAKKKADKVVVSIFVNPTQFGAGEDFDSYPRTAETDEKKLALASADLLFIPSVFEMYHRNTKTTVSVASFSNLHCGAYRPGHFDGVTTVVNKLFNMVQPDLAFFGEKDFQQLAVIRKMVDDLNIPVQVNGVATEREADGLAMSSRNGFLSDHERNVAPELYRTLSKIRDEILQGQQGFRKLEEAACQQLLTFGFKVDYFSICRSIDLEQAENTDNELVILAAARLGKPRLIDNVCFSRV